MQKCAAAFWSVLLLFLSLFGVIGCEVTGAGKVERGAFPTSEQNKILIRRWLDEVFTRGDLDKADEVFAHNYALHDPGYPHNVHGPAGIKRYVTTYRAAFPDLELTLEDSSLKETK